MNNLLLQEAVDIAEELYNYFLEKGHNKRTAAALAHIASDVYLTNKEIYNSTLFYAHDKDE